jgi:hypothetical protein
MFRLQIIELSRHYGIALLAVAAINLAISGQSAFSQNARGTLGNPDAGGRGLNDARGSSLGSDRSTSDPRGSGTNSSSSNSKSADASSSSQGSSKSSGGGGSTSSGVGDKGTDNDSGGGSEGGGGSASSTSSGPNVDRRPATYTFEEVRGWVSRLFSSVLIEKFVRSCVWDFGGMLDGQTCCFD